MFSGIEDDVRGPGGPEKSRRCSCALHIVILTY